MACDFHKAGWISINYFESDKFKLQALIRFQCGRIKKLRFRGEENWCSELKNPQLKP
jgi:hypothetical protein